MAADQSFLQIQWTDEAGNDQAIDFDAAIEENYSTNAELTEHAVESGSNISDHVRPKNDTFSISAMISGTPFYQPTFGMDGATGSVSGQQITVGNQTLSVNTWSFSASFSRVFNVDQQLRTLIKGGETVTLVTGVRTIENCVIVGYKWTRSVKNGNDLVCALDLAQVRIATTQSTTVAAPAQRRGQQQGNAGSRPAQTDNRSLAARADDFSGGAISSFFGGGS